MRYQFQSDTGQFSWRPKIFTEAIKVLISVNVVLYLLKVISHPQIDLTEIFGLSAKTVWPMIWQPVTYMFMHGDVWHVAINMLVLWMFGSEMEMIWGRKEFLKYYFITGIGSGLVWLLFNLTGSYSILIGASGAIYGVLLAYGMMFPNRTVYLYFLFPVKVKWFVIFIGAVAFFSSFNASSGISHLTHLSGMLIGYLYLKANGHWRSLTFSIRKYFVEFRSHQREKSQTKQAEFKQEVDQILDRINDVGYDGLTEAEKNRLFAASKRISREQQNKN